MEGGWTSGGNTPRLCLSSQVRHDSQVQSPHEIATYLSIYFYIYSLLFTLVRMYVCMYICMYAYAYAHNTLHISYQSTSLPLSPLSLSFSPSSLFLSFFFFSFLSFSLCAQPTRRDKEISYQPTHSQSKRERVPGFGPKCEFVSYRTLYGAYACVVATYVG